MDVWKIIILSKWVICRFHVNLPGSRVHMFLHVMTMTILKHAIDIKHKNNKSILTSIYQYLKSMNIRISGNQLISISISKINAFQITSSMM